MSGTRPSDARLYLLLCLMILFWSLNYVVVKVVLRDFSPLFVAGLRTIFAGAFILPIYLWKESGNKDVWRWKELRILGGLGICGVVLNQLLFVLGLSRTSVAHAAIIIAMTPMLVLLLASAIGQERMTARKSLGMAIALGGVAVLQLARSQQAAVTFLGDVLMFLAALAFAIFTVFGKRVTKRYSGIVVNGFAYVGGALVLLPVTVWASSDSAPSNASIEAWLGVLYMAVFSSVISYLIYYHALTYIAASRVSAFSYLQPLAAILFAIPILHERVTAPLLIGGTLVLTGVYVTERA